MENGGEGRVWIKDFSRFFLSAKWGLLGRIGPAGCVPVFVMLSGMFMLDTKRSLPLTKLLFHNCLRVLVCLLLWSGIYAVASYMLAGGRFSWEGLWQNILSALRGNTHYHLWCR